MDADCAVESAKLHTIRKSASGTGLERPNSGQHNSMLSSIMWLSLLDTETIIACVSSFELVEVLERFIAQRPTEPPRVSLHKSTSLMAVIDPRQRMNMSMHTVTGYAARRYALTDNEPDKQ